MTEERPADIHPATPRAGSSIGIIGGGQLARMTAVAAIQLGYRVSVIEKDLNCPASAVAAVTAADWNDLPTLFCFASQVDSVLLENEFVNASLLKALEERGHAVRPSSRTMHVVQDKFLQKEALQRAGIATVEARETSTIEAATNVIQELGLPVVLKARRNGYDGKGNVTVRAREELKAAWKRLGGEDGNPLYVEQYCQFTNELAVIAVRSVTGEIALYPTVETVQENHVCRLVRAPARVESSIAAQAQQLARQAIEAVQCVGSMGVELFLADNGRLVVNELAPRVHNSGHYTIEACVCSQFENHIRAVFGLPLGSTRMLAPAAVMVNLLGKASGSGQPNGMAEALAVKGAHIHIYGKASTGAGRKMGHVTVLGETMTEAEQAAVQAAELITFGSK